MRALAAVSLAWLALGCGDETAGEALPLVPPADAPCAPGELAIDDGRCMAAGIQPDGCAAGELARPDGGCEQAGIPPEACGAGFVPDGARGCTPILPEAACADGLLAVPGDEACRELAPCGAAPWGAIPVDSDTEHVDLAYAGGDSDGSAAKPWTSIGDGVAAATSGAIVAIAAGVYAEDVFVAGKSLRLWGRCPELVEIAGTANALAAIDVRGPDGGTEIRSLSVTGGAVGIGASGVTDLVVDGVWVHDTADYGLDIEAALGPTSAIVSNTVVERAGGSGVFVSGAAVSFADVAVRGTIATGPADGAGILARSGGGAPARVTVERALLAHNVKKGIRVFGSEVSIDGVAVLGNDDPTGAAAAGISATADDQGAPSILSVTRSVIADNGQVGVLASGATLTMDATVVRDGRPRRSDGGEGRGLTVQVDPATGMGASAALRWSSIEANHYVGLAAIGADTVLEGVLVRDVRPDQSDGSAGWGVVAQLDEPTTHRPMLRMAGSAVERTFAAGIFIDGVDAQVEGTAVRDVEPRAADAWGGVGILAQLNTASGSRADAVVRSSLVERTREAGIFAGACDIVVEASHVRDTFVDSEGLSGRGISLQVDPATGTPASGEVHGCVVERSHAQGIAVLGSSGVVTGTVVRDTAAQPGDQLYGDGIAVLTIHQPAALTVTGSLVDRSARGGIVTWGGHVSLGSSQLRCNPIHLNGETAEGRPFAFEDLGGNGCGCDDQVEVCKSSSSELEPPAPLPEPSP